MDAVGMPLSYRNWEPLTEKPIQNILKAYGKVWRCFREIGGITVKRNKWMILALGLALAMPTNAMAYTMPETVRVGLESVCKNAASARIGAGELLIGMAEDGDFTEGGSISSSGSYTVSAAGSNYLALDTKMDCRDALELAEDLEDEGFTAYATYLVDEYWTVYVSGSSAAEVEDAAGEDTSRVQNFPGFLLTGEDTHILLPEGAALMGTTQEDTINLNGKRYRGAMTFAVNGSALTAINIVDLEEYLYGVVPAEMPASYEQEALKAQAVAARTYAITKLGAHMSSGYQLCDTTACQVYNGYSGEAAASTKAVDATRGEIVCYQGQPIEAVFSASTGGYTENSENVWGTKVAYLRAVPEIAEYGDNAWTKTLTLEQLDALLRQKGENIGSAEDIVIKKISSGGRVQELQIVGSSGTKTLTKEEIRTYFSGACGSLPSKMFTINGRGGAISADGAGSAIRQSIPAAAKSGSLLEAVQENGIIVKTENTLATLNGKKLQPELVQESSQPITSVQDGDYAEYSVSFSTVQNGKFIFEGVGNGHGAGMSQKGAQGMAQMGYSYEEILSHYYTGITIED